MCAASEKFSAIVLDRARIEHARVGAPAHAGEDPFEIEIDRIADQRFRKRRRLRQEGPVIGLHGARGVHAGPHLKGRDDIEHRKARDALGMIEREAIADAAAAVVADQGETLVAELLHQLHHRRGHGALGIGRMVGRGLRACRSRHSRSDRRSRACNAWQAPARSGDTWRRSADGRAARAAARPCRRCGRTAWRLSSR